MNRNQKNVLSFLLILSFIALLGVIFVRSDFYKENFRKKNEQLFKKVLPFSNLPGSNNQPSLFARFYMNLSDFYMEVKKTTSQALKKTSNWCLDTFVTSLSFCSDKKTLIPFICSFGITSVASPILYFLGTLGYPKLRLATLVATVLLIKRTYDRLEKKDEFQLESKALLYGVNAGVLVTTILYSIARLKKGVTLVANTLNKGPVCLVKDACGWILRGKKKK